MISFSHTNTHPLATALGWFSLGLGVAQLAAPRALARWTGRARTPPLLMRALGLRELTTGVGLLSSHRKAGWLWARVAGDAMDILLLGVSLASGARRGRAAVAASAVVAVTALDVMAGKRASAQQAPQPTKTSIIVNRPVEECFGFWTDVSNLSRFLQAPSREPGQLEVVDSTPNLSLVWREVDGATGRSYTARFEPAPVAGATLIEVELGGQFTHEHLRRFKQYMEAGETPTTRGQPAGRRSILGRTFRGIES